jgi:hypothetical protein
MIAQRKRNRNLPIAERKRNRNFPAASRKARITGAASGEPMKIAKYARKARIAGRTASKFAFSLFLPRHLANPVNAEALVTKM